MSSPMFSAHRSLGGWALLTSHVSLLPEPIDHDKHHRHREEGQHPHKHNGIWILVPEEMGQNGHVSTSFPHTDPHLSAHHTRGVWPGETLPAPAGCDRLSHLETQLWEKEVRYSEFRRRRLQVEGSISLAPLLHYSPKSAHH